MKPKGKLKEREKKKKDNIGQGFFASKKFCRSNSHFLGHARSTEEKLFENKAMERLGTQK